MVVQTASQSSTTGVPASASGTASTDSSQPVANPPASTRPVNSKRTSTTRARPAPSISPCNWVSVRRAPETPNHRVAGQYLLHCGLDVPQALKSYIEPGERRHNLEIRNKAGGIDIDLWLVARPGWSGQMSIYLEGRSVSLVIHSLPADNVQLDLVIDCEELTLAIPSAFRGALRANVPKDKIAFSPALEEILVVFDDGTHHVHGFIGDASGHNNLSRVSCLTLRSSKQQIGLRFLKPSWAETFKWLTRKPVEPEAELHKIYCQTQ